MVLFVRQAISLRENCFGIACASRPVCVPPAHWCPNLMRHPTCAAELPDGFERAFPDGKMHGKETRLVNLVEKTQFSRIGQSDSILYHIVSNEILPHLRAPQRRRSAQLETCDGSTEATVCAADPV